LAIFKGAGLRVWIFETRLGKERDSDSVKKVLLRPFPPRFVREFLLRPGQDCVGATGWSPKSLGEGVPPYGFANERSKIRNPNIEIRNKLKPAKPKFKIRNGPV